MELFKITCVTCRARLSVRDAALVGQIIGCPRCGMMVQVTPPADAAPIAAVAPVALGTTRPAVPPMPPMAPTFEEAPQVAEISPATPPPPVPLPAFEDTPDAIAPTPVGESAPAAASVVPVAQGWTAYKIPAFIAAGAIAGSAMVALGLTWFGEKPPAAVASNSVASPVEAPATLEMPARPEPAVSDNQTPSVDAEPAAITTDAGESLLPLEDPKPIETPQATQPEAQTPSQLSQEADAAPEPIQQEAPTDVVAEMPNVGEPRLRIDPLDVDPEGLDLTTIFSGRPKDPLAESRLPSTEEPAPSSEPAAPPIAAPTEPLAVRRDERGDVGAPNAVDELLNRKLPSINVKKMPLCRLVDLSTQLSGLPVSVGPAELRMAAVSAAAAATVDAKDATIEQMLTAALAPLRLRPVVEGEHILLKRKAEDARRAVDYPIDDLASTPEKVRQLGEWVTQLAAPEAWQAAGGDATMAIHGGKLRVEAAVPVQYEVLFVLERYRLTRGLPTRTKYPSHLLVGGSCHQALAERMSAPAMFTFTQYTPIREIFRYWQEETEIAILVDWPSLAEERVWPQTRIACSGAGNSWAEAMDSVLGPLGLAWRAVDWRAIEITTQAKADSQSVLEFYRVKADAAVNGDQVTQRVASLVGDGVAANVVFFDADSRTLLTRLPASIHRQTVTELGDVLAEAPTR